MPSWRKIRSTEALTSGPTRRAKYKGAPSNGGSAKRVAAFEVSHQGETGRTRVGLQNPSVDLSDRPARIGRPDADGDREMPARCKELRQTADSGRPVSGCEMHPYRRDQNEREMAFG